MPVWKWQTEIAITLYWSTLQRYRRFWQDSFVFWIRYKAAVFGLWARPSLLASCLPCRSPYPPRLPGKRRADFLLHLTWEPVLLLCGWKEECERGERWRKQCRVHKTWWLAPFRVCLLWPVAMRRHLYIHRAGSRPWMELLLLFFCQKSHF